MSQTEQATTEKQKNLEDRSKNWSADGKTYSKDAEIGGKL